MSVEEIKQSILNDMILYAGDDYEDDQNNFIMTLIDDASEEILNIRYPNGFDNDFMYEKAKEAVFSTYKSKIKKIAQYHYDKQGREGVKSYTENMFTISYESSGTPESYLSGIVPVSIIV